MSRYGSADVGFLLVSGLNVLGDATELEDTRTAVVEETTVLGSANQEYGYVGVKDYELVQRGFYNGAAGANNAALITPGSSKILSVGIEGNTVGKLVICTSMVQVDYKRKIARGELTKAEANYRSAYGHDEARILHALGARTADGNSQASYYDGGAGSSAGGTAYLQVTDITLGGYDDVLVKVQHSTDHSSWSDLMSMTAVTVVGAERKTVSGTVNRHLAVSWDFEGSGSGASITFMLGFARN